MDPWRIYLVCFISIIPAISLNTAASNSHSHSHLDTLEQGNSLLVQKPGDVLVSANGNFNAGFFAVGENAFCFAIWLNNGATRTPVWMANRDQPVNGRGSMLSLEKDRLVLMDYAAGIMIPEWTVDFLLLLAAAKADSSSSSSVGVQLRLLDNGNLVLQTMDEYLLWQSFGFPTDTLLPGQVLSMDICLISSRGRSNYSSGNYKLYFDNDNVLRLLYQGYDTTSIYWPPPWLDVWGNGRSPFNSSRVAVLNSSGHFTSSDHFEFSSADSGTGALQRRLTLDPDGNLRLYSYQGGRWVVSWQSMRQPCQVHGICGKNSLCKYDHVRGRECACLPGYKMNDLLDWSQGCEKDFQDDSCNMTTTTTTEEFGFLRLTHVEFYGYDLGLFDNNTLQSCEKRCIELCCNGFQLKYQEDKGTYVCFPKRKLLNGQRVTTFHGDFYLKLPKSSLDSSHQEAATWPGCSNSKPVVVLLQQDRAYQGNKANNESLIFLLWFLLVVGILESITILLVWCVLFRNDQANRAAQGYLETSTRFKRYTFSELRRATKNFSHEIGRGSTGIVYRGVLTDQRIAAIKRLHHVACQGEAEFLAEVATIGRLHHQNLIEMWGFCIQGRKHRLLVYEYMEHGSLADNLSKKALNWAKRFDIAVRTAKGLAYLHEECLEWILHCDIKPQNILLDSNFNPKVADFGMSKLINRGGNGIINNNSSFSGIRGTRGYMAPEWVYNFPITSKVDVYSYGIVILEMVTGICSAAVGDQNMEMEVHHRLASWVRDKINGGADATTTGERWIEQVADPTLDKDYDTKEMALLVQVALQCVEEVMHSRPTMNQVVQMLCSSKIERERDLMYEHY